MKISSWKINSKKSCKNRLQTTHQRHPRGWNHLKEMVSPNAGKGLLPALQDMRRAEGSANPSPDETAAPGWYTSPAPKLATAAHAWSASFRM